MNWKMILFIVITWLIAGLLAFVIDLTRKRLQYEAPIPFIRALFAGYLGLILIIGLVLLSPVIIDENERHNET
jgi:prepilin signal peptidase PulO-like enzyme (type II secretory pathway)